MSGPSFDLSGLTTEQLDKVQEQVMTAGGVLQSFRPGALDAIAIATEATTTGAGAMALSTLEKRRRSMFIRVLRAAELLREECRQAALVFAILDPNEQN